MQALLVNGIRQEFISVHDRGLQYGDGLFETTAVIDGAIRQLDLHLNRLNAGCERLGIRCPPREVLIHELNTLAHGQQRAVLKLVLTRGVGRRGYATAQNLSPSRVVILDEWPRYPAHWSEAGIEVRWCATPLAQQPLLAGIKHLNRLEQVLARREWSDPDIAEGLMCDTQGRVIGGTRTNLFVVRGGELLTPRLDQCGVAGTMRHTVVASAHAHGVRVAACDLIRADLELAEEVFLTNALIGIWPVRRIERREYKVGPFTRRLIEALGQSAQRRSSAS